MKIGRAANGHKPDRTHELTRSRVVVIGAGFGGLATAIRLAAHGYRVTVLEARPLPGGRAGQIRDRGYTFDTGPTLITAPDLLHDLWNSAGASLEDYVDIRPLEPFYRIQFQDGRSFDCSGVQERFENEIAGFNSGDIQGYRRFLEATESIYRRAFVDLGRVSFDRLATFVRVIPNLVRLGGLKSVYDFTSEYIQDPNLRTVLSFHPLFIGGNPFRASAIYSIVPYLERQGGVHFAMGGMYSLVRAMVRLLEHMGGEVHCDTPVRRIVTANRKVIGVETETGNLVTADAVVANSDSATTLLKLVQERDRSRFWSRRWRSARYSMSCFLLYFGLTTQYPQLHHHTIVMPNDFRKVVSQIFDGAGIPEDIALYIHTPTRTDPTMAPEGCESMYVLVPVPNLHTEIDWASAGDTLRERVVDHLEHKIGLECFRSSIEVEHRFTPVDFRDQLGSWLGAAFAIEPTLAQSAYFRPPNRSREIEGLYLVGAGTHPGAGVPGVLLSAEIVSNLITRDAGAGGLRVPV
jgi:phytoene desaturase